MARTTFKALPAAEAFFAHQIDNPPPEPVEMWLRQQAGLREEYLLGHCLLTPRASRPAAPDRKLS